MPAIQSARTAVSARAPASSARAATGAESALAAVARVAADMQLLFQPIVDLERGIVAGYEILTRSASRPDISFDTLVREMGGSGRTALLRLGLLEACIVERALAARTDLGPNTFVAINVSPDALALPDVQAVFARYQDLTGIVIELTEHSRAIENPRFVDGFALLRSKGARIAIDDVGAGYSNLQRILTLRPDFVKIDRALVTGIHLDEAKAALLETVGRFANSIDAWVIAEGVEEPGELQRLVQLGVPLAQGYLLGRAGPMDAPLAPEVIALLRSPGNQVLAAPLDVPAGRLRTDAVTVSGADARLDAERLLHERPELEEIVVLDGGRAVALYLRVARGLNATRASSNVTTVHLDDPLEDVAARAIARPSGQRWQPLICVDAQGSYRGVIRMEHLVHRLIALARQPGPPA